MNTAERKALHDRICMAACNYEQLNPEDGEAYTAVVQEMYELLCEIADNEVLFKEFTK